MCGRYTLTVDAALLAELFELEPLTDLEPRYNVAPTQTVPILRSAPNGGRQWARARWGLIPSWAKDESIGNRLINARAETAAEKPSFRSAFKHRRCLIPADGFYEWAKTGDGKVPHHVRFADRRPFAFAGLWERWSPPEGEAVDSCTILTTAPNELVAGIHDRMPVILPRDAFADWLAPEPLGPDAAGTMLVPHPADGMEAVTVSRHVNSPANDDPRCLEAAGGRDTLPFR
ncbi:MAG TPA: SOS response-associated peptidase [Methylomirabilota bacterium]|nr:SOS response-associated peptidase [Methylomirabilota bacterium]